MPNDAVTPTPPPAAPPADDIPESLRALIAEQGVAETATYEHLLGAGKDWWADDAEFERFLTYLRGLR
jgi:hypothetical protein